MPKTYFVTLKVEVPISEYISENMIEILESPENWYVLMRGLSGHTVSATLNETFAW
jgi:hypothetical protein